MKKFIMILAATALLSPALSAQQILSLSLESGSIDSLRNETLLNVDIDFSKGTYKLVPEKEFAKNNSDWEQIKTETKERFIQGLNKPLGKCDKAAIVSDSPKYTIRLNIISVNEKGNTAASADILSKDGKVIAHFKDFYVKGGKFGTFCNLMGDGLEECGEKIGRYISFNFLKKEFKEKVSK